MATVARQMNTGLTGSWSLTRDNQHREQLEAASNALYGVGVLSGGAVTQTAAFAVEVASGTVLFAEGHILTLSAVAAHSGLTPSTTNYLWGTITRTAAAPANPLALDTYALTLSANTTGTAPSALHFKLAVITTDGAGITAIENAPAGKYARALSAAMVSGIGGTPTLTAGAEAANARLVTIQLRDALGVALAERRLVRVWLGDADFGAEAASAPSGGVTVNTGTTIQTVTANKQLFILSNTSGIVAVTITEATAKTFYVMAEYAGRVTSAAVAFV